MNFSIHKHISYFDGYLDATSRFYTTDSVLYNLSASLLPNSYSLNKELKQSFRKEIKIIEIINVDNIASHIEKTIPKFFKKDCKSRIFFYLIDYFLWFEEFSEDCKCKYILLEGDEIPQNYLCYILCINLNINILIYFSETKK